MEPDKHSRNELLIDAAKARDEAARYHRAAVMMRDPLIEDTLLARETELLSLAETLEAQAGKLPPA